MRIWDVSLCDPVFQKESVQDGRKNEFKTGVCDLKGV